MSLGVFRFITVCILVSVSLYKVTNFAPVFDDWVLLWGARWDINWIKTYWLHPASLLEAVMLVRLVDAFHPVWWYVGLLLKAGVAYIAGSFACKIFNSTWSMWVVSILCAVSPLGIEASFFISAHSAWYSAGATLLALSFLQKYVVTCTRYYLALYVLLYLLTVFIDPFRSISLYILSIIFILLFVTSNRLKVYFVVYLTVSLIILLTSLFKMYQPVVADSNISNKSIFNYVNYFKFYFPLNLGRLLAGSVMPMKQVSGVVTNIPYILIGYILLGLTFMRTMKIVLYKDTNFIKSFSLFMIIIGFLPNWCFTPNAYLLPEHRYFALSSVGVILLFVYALQHLPVQIRYSSILCVVVLMILGNHFSLEQVSPFRQKERMKNYWRQISLEISNPTNTIMFFSGKHEFYYHYLLGAAPYPASYFVSINRISDLPKVVYSWQELVSVWCNSDKYRQVISGIIDERSLILTSAETSRTLNATCK